MELTSTDACPESPDEITPGTETPEIGTRADGDADAEAEACAPGARVLVIEDEAPVANFLAEALRARGAEVVIASDGLAGQEAFLERTPDLILCDLLIPKRNGFQLIDEFRRSAPHVPVVAMSGIYRRDKYADELAHARLFLSKPLDLVHVQEILALLDTPRPVGEAVAAPAPTKGRSREPWIPLAVLPLPRLLHLLWADGRSGLLTLRAAERQTVFMLEGGRLRFVRTNDPDLRLDRVLVQLGRVTAERIVAAQAELESRTVPTRLGEVLVEQDALKAQDLDRAIQVQLRRIIAAAFAETSGDTLFRAETAAADEDVVIDSDLRAVIMAGCMSVREQGEHLLGHLPDGACLVERASDEIDDAVRLPVAVARLLEAIDEPVRLADLVAMADLVGMRGRWLAFGLLCADLLKIRESQSPWRSVAMRATGARPITCSPLEAALELEASGATGVLRASWSDTSAWMALEKGRLVQAASSDARTRIGGLLRSAGLVTPQQLEAALKEQTSRGGRPLGHVLVEMGLLSPSALRAAVPAQVSWVVREMLSRTEWSEASFTEGESPEREAVDVAESVSDVVLATLREIDETELAEIVRGLASCRPTLDLASLRDGRFALTESEQVIADALGEDTGQILRALAASESRDPEVLRVLALGLLCTTAGIDTSWTPGGERLEIEVVE